MKAGDSVEVNMDGDRWIPATVIDVLATQFTVEHDETKHVEFFFNVHKGLTWRKL